MLAGKVTVTVVFIALFSSKAFAQLSPIQIGIIDKNRFTWNGNDVSSFVLLEAKCSELRSQIEKPQVRLVPSKGVDYSSVRRVVDLLQRLGFSIGLVVNRS